MAIPGTVTVTSIIAPTSTGDTYPVIDPRYGIDGLRNVSTNVERNAIPNDRRKQGMIVGVDSTGSTKTDYWTLLPSPWTGTDADWTAFTSGSGGITGDTYWVSGSTGNYSIKAKNDSGLDATGDYAIAEGYQTISSGYTSHSEGFNTIAGGFATHAEGLNTQAIGSISHAEGNGTIATGSVAHAEGDGTFSIGGSGSHSEGQATTALGITSHAEGISTIAGGYISHSEGIQTLASGSGSHAEGGWYDGFGFISGGTAFGDASHSEGILTTAIGIASHAGGSGTTAMTQSSLAHGINSLADGTEVIDLEIPINVLSACTITSSDPAYSQKAVVFPGNVFNEWNIYIGDFGSIFLLDNGAGTTQLIDTGSLINVYYDLGTNSTYIMDTSISATSYTTISGSSFYYLPTPFERVAISLGTNTRAIGPHSTAFGWNTIATGETAHAEGKLTWAGSNSHAEGVQTYAQGASHAEGDTTTATDYGHSEGRGTIATGNTSHAEGNETIASGVASHAEGYITIASGAYGSHAEGQQSIASGQGSHAEGVLTIASGIGSHAEGSQNNSSGDYSHTEGLGTIASGPGSHAEGNYTTAGGSSSHAEGNGTIAYGDYSHAGGFGSSASGQTSFVHGVASYAIGNSTIVLGDNITGSTANTTYVDGLNIKTLAIGPSIYNLGIDSNGYVVTGTTGTTNTDVFTTGMTFNIGNYDLTATRNDGNSYVVNLAPLATDMTVTGGTYNPITGVATFTNNSGGTFNVSGFLTGMTDTKVTAFTYNNNTFTTTLSDSTVFNATINTMTGLTINGSLSATTYLGLPTDVFVTGGTYSAGTAVYTNNTGGTFSVTGFNQSNSYKTTTGLTANVTITVPHNLNNLDILVQTKDLTTNEMVLLAVDNYQLNSVDITSSVGITNIRIMIQGI